MEDKSHVLNQIPYINTVELTNRFKRSDLIDSMAEELRTDIPDILQEGMIKIIPREKKCEKTNGSLRRPYKYLRKE